MIPTLPSREQLFNIAYYALLVLIVVIISVLTYVLLRWYWVAG